jgi:hypothetical protein
MGEKIRKIINIIMETTIEKTKSVCSNFVSVFIALFVITLWGAVPIYIISSYLHLIKRDPTLNFEAVLAIYSTLTSVASIIITFYFGTSAGSQQKSNMIDKMINNNQSK